jgi:hypothetical protein
MKGFALTALCGVLLSLSVSLSAQVPAQIIVEESGKLLLPNPEYRAISSVAVDGNFAVVGATRFDTQTYEYGNAAYLYERVGSTWTFRTTLADERADNWMSVSVRVAIQGNVIALARPLDQTLYIFERVGTSWVRTQVMGAPPGVNDVGWDVEIDNGTIFLGTASGRYQGSALRKGASGQWEAVGVVSATPNNGGGPEFLGGDVDIIGNVLAVAAPAYGSRGEESWRSELPIFDGGPGTWSQVALLTDPTGQESLTFATNIAVDSAAVLASGNVNRGIHVFPAALGWRYLRSLRSRDALMLSSPQAMGAAISTDQGLAVVGAPGDDARGLNAGSISAYITDGSGLIDPYVKLMASDSVPGLSLGSIVKIGGKRVIARSAQGAYIFDLPTFNYATHPMLEYVTDDFETGNTTQWSPIVGSQFSLVSNGLTRVYRQSSLAGNAGAILANTGRTDGGIQADITPTAFDGADRWFGLAVRYTDASNYYYVTLRNTNTVQLRRMLNGSFVTLASASLPVTLNRTYAVRLEAVGKWLQVFVDGKPVIRVRDASLSQGSAGILTYKTAADFDNVAVSNSPAVTLFADEFETSGGSQWKPVGVGAWSIANDGSNVFLQSSSADRALAITGVEDTPFQVVQVRAKPLTFDGNDRWFGPVVRYRNDQNYTYMTVRSNNTVSLRRLAQGQIQILDSAPLPVATGTWYTLRLEVFAGRLRGYVDGKLMVEADEPLGSGQYGLATYKTTAEFDDFIALQP